MNAFFPFLVCCWYLHVLGLPCPKNDTSQESLAVVQITEHDCETSMCCQTLEEFLSNEYCYVLFYSLDGRLNSDIGGKFKQLASDWKWSKIAFGLVDVDQDRRIASAWIEPHHVPTNVMFNHGQPVGFDAADFHVLRDKYRGSPEGMSWYITKHLGDKFGGSNLHFVVPVTSYKRFRSILKGKGSFLTVVGIFPSRSTKNYRTFAQAVYTFYENRLPSTSDTQDWRDVVVFVHVESQLKFAKKIGVSGNSKSQATESQVVVYSSGAIVPEAQYGAERTWSLSDLMAFVQEWLPVSEYDWDDDNHDL